MTPFWHPVSTLLLADPVSYATSGVLRLMLPAGGLTLRYAGDRMWPAVAHGAVVTGAPLDATALHAGDVVIADVAGIPDLLRVRRRTESEVELIADADPAFATRVPVASVLGCVPGLSRQEAWRGRGRRRLSLDLREAWRGRVSSAEDLAESVRHKYDMQAPYYARVAEAGLDEELSRRICDRFPQQGDVLVVGCGTGRECFDLADLGFRVTGIDFSEGMISAARAESAQRGSDVRFELGDVRELERDPASLDAVLFTYDVYSFIPTRGERVEVLRALGERLRPGGGIFLSARRTKRVYDRLVLTAQWLSRNARGEWGASHTRYIGPDGELYRSAVRVFSPRGLRREVAAAGFADGRWQGGHALLEPR